MKTMRTIKPEELTKMPRAPMEWSRDDDGNFQITVRDEAGTPLAVEMTEQESAVFGKTYDELANIAELSRSDLTALAKVLAGRDAGENLLGATLRFPALNATVTFEEYGGQAYRVVTDGLGNIYAIPVSDITRWTFGL